MAKYFLRPEAGPVPFDKLQKRAQSALQAIIEVLNEAVRSTKVSSKETATDTRRASRIFFVSGEPGSGKSTLYLTLKEMLSDKPGSGVYREHLGKIDLSILKGTVRWLDTLDLEVAGDEGENLLAAVLVRLIEELINSNDSDTVLSAPCEGAIKDLEELAADIGIAWEGNLQARAGALDPDTYAEEVMRTQRARLRVNERLRKSLDKLADKQCYGCNEGTLFVLPVDDFYLKPDASLQLLRLLRMISIPRLFFLVMGDIKTIEALFVEKSLADWTKVAGDRIYAARADRLSDALSRARELRARYLRKLLPPAQRAEIEAMDWDEALRFDPQPIKPTGKLGKLLKEINLDVLGAEEPTRSENDICKAPSNLLTFLLCPPYSEEEEKNEIEDENNRANDTTKVEQSSGKDTEKHIREAREAYTALQILDATSREVMDLWFAFYELNNPSDRDEDSNRDKAPPLLSLAINFVKLVIEEQDFLNEEQLANLRDGVLPTRHYSIRDIQFDMTRLSLEPEQNPWEDPTQAGKPRREQERRKERLWVRSHRSWKLASKTNEGESKEEAELFGKLPPRQTAWIILLHDLAWKWKPESVTGNLVNRLLDGLDEWSRNTLKPSARSKKEKNIEVKDLRLEHLEKLRWKKKDDSKDTLDPSTDFPGWAVLEVESEEHGKIYKHFPKPDFDTFRDIDRFLFLWSSGLEWLRKLWKDANDAEKQAKAASIVATDAEAQAKEAEDTVAQKRAMPADGKNIAPKPIESKTDDASKDADNLAAQIREAEDAATQKRALAAKARENCNDKEDDAKKAKEKVGGDNWEQQLKKYVDLWELANWIVVNDKYDDFARRPDDTWFAVQLGAFRSKSDWLNKRKETPTDKDS